MDAVWTLTCLIFVLSFQTIDTNTFTVNFPDRITISENDDSSQVLFTVDCTYTTNGGGSGSSTENPCSSCLISNNLDSDVFYMSGMIVGKNACGTTSCGNYPAATACSSSPGCLTAGTYSISFKCSYGSVQSGVKVMTVEVLAELPILTINLPAATNADNSMIQGHTIFTVEKVSGPVIVQRVKNIAVANSYLLDTANLFELNTANGQVYINADPRLEFYYTYTMRVCIYSRRQSACGNLTINFDGCFQTPNCINQTSATYSDTHLIGATLATMTYNPPSAHFYAISSVWQNLRFEIISPKNLNEAAINDTTGVMYTTGNVTVWPNYPSIYRYVTVRVNNTGYSCSYSSTCTIGFTFNFTNWPISFVGTPYYYTIHEDTDVLTTVVNIITFDYNNPAHDNVTCTLTSNSDPVLLELYHNGNHNYNSYFLRKKACLDPGCGYLEDNFLCDRSLSCMNYDQVPMYTVVIKCNDFYGSSASTTFTLTIDENDAPVWRYVPSITVNTDEVSEHDILYAIYYTDTEGESLTYNYTVNPAQPSPALFSFDLSGNYYNNPANITSIRFEWDLHNTSYLVTWSAYDRRNMVHSNLTIYLREYCGPTPECNDSTKLVSDQIGVNYELFDIFTLMITPSSGSYTSLTYRIISASTGLFNVNSVTGKVTTLSALPVKNPPATTTYTIVANVFDTAACDVAACILSVQVSFTNFPLSITNVGGVTKSIHEDTETAVTLLTIATSDANTVDEVTCFVNETASIPSNNGIFSAVETDTGTNIWRLVSKPDPNFDYDTHSTYTVVVTCNDKYGSTDTESMTVNILDNQAPVMTNLNSPTTLNLDPMTTRSGDTIFTLTVTDAENDDLDYSCTVDNHFVPMDCKTNGVLKLRRKVVVPDENGTTYDVVICVNDSSHDHFICETLTVTFTSSKTNPVLSNLPDTITVNEDTAVGTTVFTVSVTDPDANEIRTLSMTVYPSSSAFFLHATLGTISLDLPLDFEAVSTYHLVVNVTDPYLSCLVAKVLTINVGDINEQPTLTLDQTTFSTTEEDSGYQIAEIPFKCTDVDAGQTPNLTITGGPKNAYFSLEPTTGVLSFAQDWDLENNSLPLTTSLDIACEDGHGLSSEVTIVVNIAAKNEFAPALRTTAENITIYNNQTLLDSLLTITATDDDYGDDGVFEYKIIGKGKGSTYFRMNSQGKLFISQYIDWNYNYMFYFTIEVSDSEDQPLTSFVDVIVTYIAPPYVEPRKEGARCILCTKIGIAVVATLSVEGFLIFVLFFHISVCMKIWEICRLKPKKRKQTMTDLNKEDNAIEEDDDPYRPGSEMLIRNLPDHRPPSPFNYQSPSKITSEPPPAAEYLPPATKVINTANIPDQTLRHSHYRNKTLGDDIISLSNMNFTNQASNLTTISGRDIPRMRNFPSLFQASEVLPPNYLPENFESRRTLYVPTLHDESAALEAKAGSHVIVSPMFDRPNKHILYSDGNRDIPPIGQPSSAMDF